MSLHGSLPSGLRPLGLLGSGGRTPGEGRAAERGPGPRALSEALPSLPANVASPEIAVHPLQWYDSSLTLAPESVQTGPRDHMGWGWGQVGASFSSASARATCVPDVARGFRGTLDIVSWFARKKSKALEEAGAGISPVVSEPLLQSFPPKLMLPPVHSCCPRKVKRIG